MGKCKENKFKSFVDSVQIPNVADNLSSSNLRGNNASSVKTQGFAVASLSNGRLTKKFISFRDTKEVREAKSQDHDYTNFVQLYGLGRGGRRPPIQITSLSSSLNEIANADAPANSPRHNVSYGEGQQRQDEEFVFAPVSDVELQPGLNLVGGDQNRRRRSERNYKVVQDEEVYSNPSPSFVFDKLDKNERPGSMNSANAKDDYYENGEPLWQNVHNYQQQSQTYIEKEFFDKKCGNRNNGADPHDHDLVSGYFSNEIIRPEFEQIKMPNLKNTFHNPYNAFDNFDWENDGDFKELIDDDVDDDASDDSSLLDDCRSNTTHRDYETSSKGIRDWLNSSDEADYSSNSKHYYNDISKTLWTPSKYRNDILEITDDIDPFSGEVPAKRKRLSNNPDVLADVIDMDLKNLNEGKSDMSKTNHNLKKPSNKVNNRDAERRIFFNNDYDDDSEDSQCSTLTEKLISGTELKVGGDKYNYSKTTSAAKNSLHKSPKENFNFSPVICYGEEDGLMVYE